MSGVIKKIASSVNFPKNRYDNQIYFGVGVEDSMIDMKASYVELELELPSLPNYHSVVLGQDGMMYNASALFRDASLKESKTSKSLADTMYVNILSNNLEYYSKGSNNVVADALFDGKGHASSGNSVVSVFDNSYDDPTPVVRCPLSLLYPASVGQSDVFPQHDDLTFRFLMEPQLQVFMRAIKAGAYVSGAVELPVDASGNLDNQDACANVAANSAVFTPSALGVVANYAVGDRVLFLGTLGGNPVVGSRTITATTPDAAPASGTITMNMAISSAASLTNVRIVKLADFYGTINANDLNLTGKVLTLNGTLPLKEQDLWKDTVCTLNYTSIDTSGVQTLKSVENKIDSATVVGNDITALTFVNDITVPTRGSIVNISVQPLYTNISADWSLTNAHLILYRRHVSMEHQSQMVVSNFSSVNVGMVGGLNRFQYSIKAPINAYNCYVFTPSGTNLFSTASGLRDYLISVDDVPLTSIYVDSSGSAVHKDNLLRVFGNSPYYAPKSIVANRDKEVASGFEPTMFVGKVFHSLMKGDPQVLPFEHPDRNIKVELVAADGSTTPTKNVYIFLEKWDQI
jgi:hypothetical protein